MEKFWFVIGVSFCYGASFIFSTLLVLYSENLLKRNQVFDSFYILIMDLVPSLAIFVVNVTILKLVKRISFRQKQIETQLSFSSWLSNKEGCCNKSLIIQARSNSEIANMLTLGVIFYSLLFIPRCVYWFLLHFDGTAAITGYFSPLVNISIILNSLCHVLVLIVSNRDIRTAYSEIHFWFMGKTRTLGNRKVQNKKMQSSFKIILTD